MSRPFRARALVSVLLSFAAAGCQDYNFNPVGHCMLQPGTQKFTLSNVSSADVLFVVDDSGSMAGEQERLAAAFTDFVDNLTSTNQARAGRGLLPLDFHVAVTTTSIFRNQQRGGANPPTCRSDCAGAGGQLACCSVGAPALFGPRRCTTLGSTAPSQCPMAGTACSNACNGYKGELYCCDATNGTFPTGSTDSTYGQLVTCGTAGIPCGELRTHYDWSDTQCTAPGATGPTPAAQGVSFEGFPYPDGAFVGSTSLAAGVNPNPRVLHFDKRLYLSSQGTNAQGFSMAELKRFFEQNVHVGTCGSMEEQGLQASYRAITDAIAGKQLDTYAYDWAAGVTSGTSARVSPSFSVAGGLPTPAARAVWPTTNSKLVVVYVGDEDDCSSPKDPSSGVVLLSSDYAGGDACVRDATETAPLGPKEYGVSSFVSYLTGLNRPLGAAFIVSANTASGDDVSCSNDGCTAAICCDRPCVAGLNEAHLTDPDYSTSSYWHLCGDWQNPATCVCAADICGGQAPGTRFVEAAKSLKSKGADVVVGSICGDFRPLLRQVAEIVKTPETLSLPTQPAEAGIALLRIADSSGLTRKLCGRPLAPRRPTNYTLDEARATGRDWWFVPTKDPAAPFDPSPASTETPVATATQFVYINPGGACIANPGETYSLDYLGVVPPGGCSTMPGDHTIDAGPDGVIGTSDDIDILNGSLDCQNKLGGRFQDWQCYVPPGLSTGTCQCRSGG